MMAALVEDIKAWLRETFPERKVYIRSDGRVQFFSFGPGLQAILATMTLLFLGWVAFATVNVVFKNRIISVRENHYRQMQTAYENRVADLQLSYDEVNAALVATDDRFHATAGELEAKQNTILYFLDRKRQVDAALAAAGKPVVGGKPPVDDEGFALPQGMGGNDVRMEVGNLSIRPDAGDRKPAKRTQHSSFLDFGGTVDHIAGVLFGKRKNHDAPTAVIVRHPVLKQLAMQTERVRRIGAGETVLMARAENETAKGVHQIQTLLRRTGIDPGQFMARIAAHRGAGGPEIPLDVARATGVTDPAFAATYIRANATLGELNRLLFGLNRMPLSIPVAGEQFEYSSGFGARLDPITGRYAFHPGIDFSGPWGSVVRSTAPGVVVGAEYNDSYGNVVEINHGYGIHTRYGHLSEILVRVGTKVEKGSPIGRLGSTGRSTGPHVHYEVWYDGNLRNPKNFIEAGRYVLKQG
jgi:murein DD-endopeptidase MepM/ murein hydrolase activator NlpD